MHNPFEAARRDINLDALLEAIGECLRTEHPAIEETLPEPFAALVERLEQALSGEGSLCEGPALRHTSHAHAH